MPEPKSIYEEGFLAAFTSYCPYEWYTQEAAEWRDGYEYGRIFVVAFEGKSPPRPLSRMMVKREWKKFIAKE